jgi:Na+/alanine symporter
MTYAAKTVFAFGCYLLALGVSLLLFPNAVLGVFGIAPSTEVWVRVVGMLVLFLGAYYCLAALANLHQFFQWTVPLRASVFVFFALFVLLGYAPRVLMLFAVVDLAGAGLTMLALRGANPAARPA